MATLQEVLDYATAEYAPYTLQKNTFTTDVVPLAGQVKADEIARLAPILADTALRAYARHTNDSVLPTDHTLRQQLIDHHADLLQTVASPS